MDQTSRLPVPTSLYRLEVVHLGDLLRLWIWISTKTTLCLSDLQGPICIDGAFRQACSRAFDTLHHHPLLTAIRSSSHKQECYPFLELTVSSGSRKRLPSGTITQHLIHSNAPVLRIKRGPLGTLLPRYGFTEARGTFDH
ncbi:hypothetical protein NPIL_63701 [Nephila pilipes]|uniref:Uncharacterized protein n=1 Tax=Nephila pilipes TaxID=299642 RepID=A0A8X6PQY8_NEPPI|nr:hypothetical protein NPIL_63701 [Nephila pilipes]